MLEVVALVGMMQIAVADHVETSEIGVDRRPQAAISYGTTPVNLTPAEEAVANCPNNLVPNGGFENPTSCPSTSAQVSLAAPWFLPTPGSSDYFNTCAGSNPGVWGAPVGVYNNEPPHGGNGYVGSRYYGNYPPNPLTDYREYVETPLTASLVPGQTYQISLWVSLSEVVSYWGIKEISIYFSAGPIYSGSQGPLAVTPQFTYSGAPIMTTNGWFHITGSYVAAGGEDHITIGNFKNDAMTTATPGAGGCCSVSYYCIDDVCITGPAGPLSGACCVPGAAGGCQNLSPTQCASLNGLYFGNGTSCNGVVCPPFGACCLGGPSGNVCQIKTAAQCQALGGTYLGNGSTCTPGDPCNPPTGACCYPVPGNPDLQCVVTTAALCQSQYGGTYQGNGVPCSVAQCNPVGACCYQKAGFPNSFCVVTTQNICTSTYQGVYHGNGTSCQPDPCVQSGACCYINTTGVPQCVITTQADCQNNLGGVYGGNGSTCNPDPCHNVGACCIPNAAGGSQCVMLPPGPCAAQGGSFLGVGTQCGPGVTCPPNGACCVPVPGTTFTQCITTTQIDCVQNHQGVWQGANSTCTPDPCNPTGACCWGTPPSCIIVTQSDCLSQYNGTWMGPNTSCTPNPCVPSGACCYVDATGVLTCIVTTQADCLQNLQGTWQGANTSCTPNPCVPTGACCYTVPPSTTPQCIVTTQADCVQNLHGTWQGANTSCTPNPCDPTGACCYQQSATAPVQCTIVTQSQCATFPNSIWQGPNTTCSPNPCPPGIGACCYQPQGSILYLCTTTSAADCIQNLHGFYLGNGSSCTNAKCGPCTKPPPKMVAWWTLDDLTGPLAKESIAGQHAQFKPSTATGPVTSPGVRQTSLRFDGVDDFLQVPANAPLKHGVTNFTVDAWVRWGYYNGSTAPEIVSQNGYRFRLLTGSTSPAGLSLWMTGGIGKNVIQAGVVPMNTWTFITATYQQPTTTTSNNGITKLYVNGALVFTDTTGPVNNFSSNGKLRIGTSMAGTFGTYHLGNIDEVEIFRRVLTAAEINQIYSLGKCKQRCQVPSNTPFCLNQNTVTVPVTLSNDSAVPHPYTVTFQTIGAGGTCTINGPTVFTPLFSNPVTVPAASSVTVNVTIQRPIGMTAALQVGCYQVTMTNNDTGALTTCQGSVIDRRDLCAVITVCCISTGTAVPVGFPVNTGFNLTNNTALPFNNLPIKVQAVDENTGLPSLRIGLNGLPPGTRYIGNLTIPPGTTVPVPFSATYYENHDLGGDELVLSADLDGDGVYEPLATQMLMSRVPTDCLSDIAPATPNHATDIDDLLQVINHWGPCAALPADCPSDIDGDQDTDIDDLLAVINAWGACPAP